MRIAGAVDEALQRVSADEGANSRFASGIGARLSSTLYRLNAVCSSGPRLCCWPSSVTYQTPREDRNQGLETSYR